MGYGVWEKTTILLNFADIYLWKVGLMSDWELPVMTGSHCEYEHLTVTLAAKKRYSNRWRIDLDWLGHGVSCNEGIGEISGPEVSS